MSAPDPIRFDSHNLSSEALRVRLAAAEALVREQAEDEGLWFVARTAPEGYLQAALRRLHEAVEGEAVKRAVEPANRKE